MKTKPNVEFSKALVGKWDGFQVLRNSRGVVPIDGIVTFEEGGALKFDCRAKLGAMSRQIIGFGNWQVKDGQLVCVIEGSNLSKDVPNGSARMVQLREVSEKEMLYIDPNDQRTYSAKRVTGTASATPPTPKKK